MAGPNLVVNDASWRGLDSFGFSTPVDGFSPKIRVLNPDTLVCANAAIGHGKFYFGCIGKEREPLAVFTWTARILGKVITTERDVLGRRGNGLAAGGGENIIRSDAKYARGSATPDAPWSLLQECPRPPASGAQSSFSRCALCARNRGLSAGGSCMARTARAPS